MRAAVRASPRRRRALITMGLCTLVLVIWWAMRAPAPPPPPLVPFGPGDTLSAQVRWVVDGTTIQVALDGGQEHVAYLGIAALGPPATEANRRLVQGQRVWLELDAPLRDGEGRLLAYVYGGDLMVNAELVRLGHAQMAMLWPHGKYQELFLMLQWEAREARQGLWGAK